MAGKGGFLAEKIKQKEKNNKINISMVQYGSSN
jgi:hypothetical protein